jgi:uncharacterized lipoprotein YmbA
MNTRLSQICSLLACVGCLCLPACISFKPAHDTARFFLLSPTAEAKVAPSPALTRALSIGVGKIKVPAYLLRDALAVRQNSNEVKYLENAVWAERLDNGLQRVFAEDLARLLATDRIRLSAWQPEDVQLEVYVSIDRFEVDVDGQGEVSARWRILSPGGERTLKSGQCHASRKGPAPTPDPRAVVATLSLLVEDLSREVANAAKP